MKAALAVLVLVALGFAAVMLVPAFNGNADTGMTEECRDDPRTCSPLAGLLGDVTALWAAALEMPDWQLADGARREAAVPRVDEGLRVARMRLASGRVVVVRYACSEVADDEDCPQEIALCTAGTMIDADELGGVDRDWQRRRRAGSARVRCRAGDEQGRLVIYPQGGRLRVVAPAGAARLEFE